VRFVRDLARVYWKMQQQLRLKHVDVKPGNVVVRVETGDQRFAGQAQLVDWLVAEALRTRRWPLTFFPCDFGMAMALDANCEGCGTVMLWVAGLAG
jgi:hypothetical protein